MLSTKVKVKISGTAPLICNRFTDAAQLKATNGSRLSGVGDKGTPREQAEPKLYKSANGKAYVIPQPNLFRCLIDAGTYFKAGKSKVTTQKSSLLCSCVRVEGSEIPIESPDQWEVDTRAVRIPATGGRILCHRPCFQNWSLRFTLMIDPDFISVKLMREIVDAAGLRIGLGDFRPACKGPYGTFVVDEWN